jgi:hypothetical protein
MATRVGLRYIVAPCRTALYRRAADHLTFERDSSFDVHTLVDDHTSVDGCVTVENSAGHWIACYVAPASRRVSVLGPPKSHTLSTRSMQR